MLLNYIKIAWRNLIKQRLYSLINISGLAVGLAVCMMIMLYVTHEMSYDRFHKNVKNIVKAQAQIKFGGNTMNMDYLSYASGPMVKQVQPKVSDYMRTLSSYKEVVVNNITDPVTKFAEEKFLFADAGFFNFFTFKLLNGDASGVLVKPYSVVITSDMARKYFGNTNPLGKILTIKTDGLHNYQVTGVAENTPSNSSINFNFIASSSSLPAMQEAKKMIGAQEAGPGSFDLYLSMKNAADTASVRHSLQSLVKNNKEFSTFFTLSPLADLHLRNNFGDFSNIKYLKIFPLVAILILLLALVNYMSLSTARATLRAKEVGVRKISGASRSTIAKQFYTESLLFTLMSFILGYLLCYAFKPWFLNVLHLKIDNSFLYNPAVLLSLLCLLILTSLIAGSYPSLILSSFKPVVTLKGKMSRQAGGVAVRKVFTVLQFTIAIGLIICGIVIDRQLYFFRHTDTGINRENVIMIPVSGSFAKNYPAFKHDVQLLGGVDNTATSHYGMFKGYDELFLNGKSKNESIALSTLSVDNDYISTLGIQWKLKPVLNNSAVRKHKIVINEEAIQKLHLAANPVGTYIKSGDQQFEITGVVKNFNFTSMEYAIQPLALMIASDTAAAWSLAGCNLFARIKPHTNLPALIGEMQNLYKKYDQQTPFSYSFMDDAFNAQYQAEDRLGSIFSIFTYITVILATLGLFGLAAFTIEQRAKEIGIRKVLGASLVSINTLLSREFLKLVIISIVVASPIAWWFMHTWLQGFAYRINISWWVFAAAGSVAVLTAVITVSYHAIRAAFANPINSLRSE